MEAILAVNSSSGTGSYLVHVIYDGSSLSIHCDCQAGKLGQSCRHKFGIISGNQEILADKNQSVELERIQGWLQKTTIPNLLNQLNDAESQAQKAKNDLAQIKKRFEKAIRDGA